MELKQLLEFSVQKNASDLHLSPGLPPMIRIEGELQIIDTMSSLNTLMIENLVYSIMEKDQKRKFESALEVDFAAMIPSVARFRVNIFHQLHGIAATFRIIPRDVPRLDPSMPSIFKQLVELTDGLILITGPTGSGKSTTLAAMVDYINTNHTLHVITIEDPIEFIHHSKKSLINQRQIHHDTHSFSAALHSALREDPNVILLGEMRDLETIRLALTAAETGHLVMATLHTPSAPRAINRIIDIFPASEKSMIRNMLSESLQAVICQKLVKKIPSGRVPIFEIMLGTPSIRNLIREDKIAQMYTIIQTNREIGMCTLDQSLQELISKNIITTQTAKEVIKKW